MTDTNPLTAKDIAYHGNQAGAKAVIVSPLHFEMIDTIHAECSTLLHLIAFGEASGNWLSFDDLCTAQDGTV